MNNQPLVSVFIPYYNDAKFLPTAIDAVLASSYQNFELILLNHATRDNCREIARSYPDKRIKHIDAPYNMGLGGGGWLMRQFLSVARGKYVKFLCADDVIATDGLEKLVEYMETHSDKDFAFGNVEYIDVHGKSLGDNWFKNREHFSIHNDEVECLKLCADYKGFLPYIGSIVRREILNTININTTYIMMFDVSLWCILLCNGYKIGYVDKIVAGYRIHPEQVSAVEKGQLVAREVFFESGDFWRIFQQIKDVNLAKRVFQNSDIFKNLADANDIPFAVAEYFWRTRLITGAYCYLTDVLDNDGYRKYLQKTYDYTIYSFRKCLCIETGTVVSLRGFKKWKQDHIYSVPLAETTWLQLMFLTMRKIYKTVLLKDLKQRIRKKRKYSL